MWVPNQQEQIDTIEEEQNVKQAMTYDNRYQYRRIHVMSRQFLSRQFMQIGVVFLQFLWLLQLVQYDVVDIIPVVGLVWCSCSSCCISVFGVVFFNWSSLVQSLQLSVNGVVRCSWCSLMQFSVVSVVAVMWCNWCSQVKFGVVGRVAVVGLVWCSCIWYICSCCSVVYKLHQPAPIFFVLELLFAF